jgi:hypothetical protein
MFDEQAQRSDPSIDMCAALLPLLVEIPALVERIGPSPARCFRQIYLSDTCAITERDLCDLNPARIPRGECSTSSSQAPPGRHDIREVRKDR